MPNGILQFLQDCLLAVVKFVSVSDGKVCFLAEAAIEAVLGKSALSYLFCPAHLYYKSVRAYLAVAPLLFISALCSGSRGISIIFVKPFYGRM